MTASLRKRRAAGLLLVAILAVGGVLTPGAADAVEPWGPHGQTLYPGTTWGDPAYGASDPTDIKHQLPAVIPNPDKVYNAKVYKRLDIADCNRHSRVVTKTTPRKTVAKRRAACLAKASSAYQRRMKAAQTKVTGFWSEMTDGGTPALVQRFPSCQRNLTLAVDYTSVNRATLSKDVAYAAAQLAKATGYRITVVDAGYANPSITIQWVPTSELSGADGRGAPDMYLPPAPQAVSSVTIAHSTVKLNANEAKVSGGTADEKATIMHELGHAVGLGHAIGFVDLMSYAGYMALESDAEIYDIPVEYGPGDLAGLKAHGYTGRC